MLRLNSHRVVGAPFALMLSSILTLGAGTAWSDAPHAFPPVPEPSGPSEDAAEREALLKDGTLFPLAARPGAKSTTPAIKPGSIVFGYAQSYSSAGTYVDFYRWEALTHVGSTFIEFDSTGALINPGTWTGRDVALRAGGAAAAAGVKVIMVVLNDNFDVNVINTVMTTPAARTTLVNSIKSLLEADGYAHGVSFDFEPFTWSAAATTGMNAFFAELRAALGPGYEVSIYSDPTPSTTQWDVSGMAPYLDYMMYSGYDFATGNTPNAITEHDAAVAQMDFYFDDVDTATPDDGLPPEKFVYTISSYGRRWTGTTAYGVAGTSASAIGFTDGLFDTTLNTAFGGPQTVNYVLGDESAWYTYNDGQDRTVTFESRRALATKIGAALSYPGSGPYAGRRLGGVGFWSMIWTMETDSWNPITNAAAARTRPYPQIFQLCEDILAPEGQEVRMVTGFEGLNFRWRDPNDSPDTVGDTDLDSVRAVVASPAGAGRPASTNNAMRVTADFESGGSNRIFFRHELLAGDAAPNIIDTNCVAAQFDASTELTYSVNAAAAFLGYSVRAVLMDRDRELEAIAVPVSLATSGWKTQTTNLTAPGAVVGYSTSEPAFQSGDGVLDTAGGGAWDIAFVGFLIEGTGALNNALITFDEISFRHLNPDSLNYRINEFAYSANNAEFVEVHGPAGAIPAGVQLRAYSGADGSVATTINLGGLTIPASGLLVVGDPSVPGVNSSTGFSDVADNLPDPGPTGLQIYGSTSGAVYDSVVYEAFGGLGDLTRLETLGVANEGPWLGSAGGSAYSFARRQDGADANINRDDFSLQPLSIGSANSSSIPSFPAIYNFETMPAAAFLTFDFASAGAVTSAVGTSPSGGKVLRVADTSGGNCAFIGDASLGASGNGYSVTGEIFLPGSGAPAQAIGIGFCASQGTTFFSDSPAGSGYEDGYWLIYHNTAAVNINNGLGNHVGEFRLVRATHDNQDGTIVQQIAAAPLASTGATAGAWTTFELTVNPNHATDKLVVKVNNNAVYAGALPAGGPISGAFVAGHREDHTGGTTAVEGTWMDNITLTASPLNGLRGWDGMTFE